MAVSTFALISKKASQLWKTGKYKKYTDAVKAASKELKKNKKIGAVKKKKAAPKKKIIKKKIRGNTHTSSRRKSAGTKPAPIGKKRVAKKQASAVRPINTGNSEYLVITNEGQFSIMAKSKQEATYKARLWVRTENANRKKSALKKFKAPVLKFERIYKSINFGKILTIQI